jgi:hypothetical protein
MKRRFTNMLEAMSYFLAGTFLLQILLDPKFSNLSNQTTVTIRYFGYGFLIVGIILAVISILPPSVMRGIRLMRNRIQTYSVFPLFLVTLCAIVVTGLPESPSLTLIIFYLVFISFLGLSYRIIAPNLKIMIKSIFGVGKSFILFGSILLWTRFVGWLFQVDLPCEFCLLILGIILFAVGCLFILTSVIIKYMKKKSNNVEKPSQDKNQENQESTSL